MVEAALAYRVFDDPQAVQVFNQTKGKPPSIGPSARVAYAWGYHAYWQKDYSAAWKHFFAATTSENRHAAAWYYRGLTELALHQNDRAVRSLGKALMLHVAHPEESQEIAIALRRVQGRLRMDLETARRDLQVRLLRKGDDFSPPERIASGQ